MVQSSFEAEYAAAANRVLQTTAKEAFDAVKMLKNVDPARYTPANGAEYPRSPFGQALFEVPLAPLTEFLHRTYEIVPAGRESSFMDLDAELSNMLWSS